MSQGPQHRSIAAHDRVNEIQRDHRQDEQRKKKFPRPAPRQQPFQPRADQSLQRHIEQQEQCNNNQHDRQHRRLRYRCSQSHGDEPADRGDRGKIREAIGEANDVERAEAQRKAQQSAKFKTRSEAGSKNGEELPENKNAPEKQSDPSGASLGKESISASEKCETEANHKDAAEHTDKHQAEQIEAITPLPQAISENAPAEPGDQPNLVKDPEGLRHISHESSSIWGRAAPSWPTMERKTCSSVVLLPASSETPARNSSSEPWATSLPL